MNFIKNKFHLVVIAFVDFIYNSFQILFSISLIKVVDALTNFNKTAFNNAILFLVICIVMQNVIYLLKIYTDKKFININMVYLKQRMYNAIFRYNIEDFSKKPLKHYASFLLNDLNMLEGRYYNSILSILNGISLLICSSAGIIYVNPWFLICIPITFLACKYFPKAFDKKIQQINNNIIKNNSNVTGITQEQLSGFATIKIFKLFNIAKSMRNKFIYNTEKSKENFSRYISFSNSLLSVFAIILTFSVYFIGGNLVLNNIITLSGLIGLNNILGKIVNNCIMLPQFFQYLNSSKSIRTHCIEIINYKDIENTKTIDNKTYDISIKNLTYKYNNENDNVLNNISFNFKANKKYAIIGDNGSGKSTFVKLIAGLYHNYNGSIKYGTHEQNKLNRECLFDILSYMSQDIFIFEDTIENNIKLYENKNNDDYKNIIKDLKINNLITKYNNKNAHNLSGGEKQKISFARVLLKNKCKNIIIADEPTSALDKQSSKNYENYLLSLENTLCIIITHNIDSHLENYDEVLLMKDGSIIEHGKYSTLTKI